MKIRIKKKIINEALDPYIEKTIIPALTPDEIGDGEKNQLRSWLKNVFTKDEGEREAALASGEDFTEQFVNYIRDFFKMKNYLIAIGVDSKVNKDEKLKGINSLRNLEDVRQIVKDFSYRYENDPGVRNRELKQRIKELKKEAKIEELPTQEGSKYQIFIPRTEGAAIVLGQMCNAKWCTSAASAQNMFNSYYKENDPLFILREKTSSEESPAMYQIHFGKQEFMDQYNKPVSQEKKQELINAVRSALGQETQQFPSLEKIDTTKEPERVVSSEPFSISYWVDDPAEEDNSYLHRDDGPAEYNVKNKERIELEWHLNGNYYGKGENPPEMWLQAGGKGWNKEEDEDYKLAKSQLKVQEHFNKFSVLWGRK